MIYWLVIVTYMAGGSYVPMIEMQKTSGAEECTVLRAQTARTIEKMAVSNTTAGAVIQEDGEDLVVVSRQNREIARMSCTNAKDQTKTAALKKGAAASPQ